MLIGQGACPKGLQEAGHCSFAVPQSSSRGQTPSSDLLTSSSCGQATSSSGLGHSRPLPSSPDPQYQDADSRLSYREASTQCDIVTEEDGNTLNFRNFTSSSHFSPLGFTANRSDSTFRNLIC